MQKSIFLFIVVLGGVYGYISTDMNCNPYPVRAEEHMPADQRALIPQGKAWRPSPVWLPAYLVATVPVRDIEPKPIKGFETSNMKPSHVVGYGMKSVNGGGYECATIEKGKYRAASVAVGMFMGLVVAVVVSLAAGWVTLRPKVTETKEE